MTLGPWEPLSQWTTLALALALALALTQRRSALTPSCSSHTLQGVAPHTTTGTKTALTLTRITCSHSLRNRYFRETQEINVRVVGPRQILTRLFLHGQPRLHVSQCCSFHSAEHRLTR